VPFLQRSRQFEQVPRDRWIKLAELEHQAFARVQEAHRRSHGPKEEAGL
jgi:hypothetical protein